MVLQIHSSNYSLQLLNVLYLNYLNTWQITKFVNCEIKNFIVSVKININIV